MSVITSTSSTGHFAMFQMSTAVEPMPSGSATALTIGPVSTSADGDRASTRMIITSVTSSCSGRSFQNGRPSGVS